MNQFTIIQIIILVVSINVFTMFFFYILRNLKDEVQYNKITYYIVDIFWISLMMYFLFKYILVDISEDFILNFVVLFSSLVLPGTCLRNYRNQYHRETGNDTILDFFEKDKDSN